MNDFGIELETHNVKKQSISLANALIVENNEINLCLSLTFPLLQTYGYAHCLFCASDENNQNMTKLESVKYINSVSLIIA